MCLKLLRSIIMIAVMIIYTASCHATETWGYCFLQNQTNHSGTYVTAGSNSAVTSDSGLWSMETYPGLHLFQFHHSGYIDTSFIHEVHYASTQVDTVTLKRLIEVQGYCTLEQWCTGFEGTQVSSGMYFTYTSTDGHYYLSVPSGLRGFSYSREGYYPGSQIEYISGPQTLPGITLEPICWMVYGYCYLEGDTLFSCSGGTGITAINGDSQCEFHTSTANDGSYEFPSLPQGYYLFLFSHTGYLGACIESEISSDTYLGEITLDDPTVPVELQSFSGIVENGNVILSWNTASEIGCYGWKVERREGSSSYTTISPLIPGFGNSVEPRQYYYTDFEVPIGQYEYRLQQIDLDGRLTLYGPVSVTVQTCPSRFVLYRACPNPFNPTTVISYQLPTAGKVHLAVYDIAGRQVAQLVDGWRNAGTHEVTFDATGLASGMYIYRIEAGEFTAQGKMVLMK